MTDWHARAWEMLRDDMRAALKDHVRDCVRCSPDNACGFAIGLNKGYSLVESRLSTTREPLL